jgi:hypothetical protein
MSFVDKDKEDDPVEDEESDEEESDEKEDPEESDEESDEEEDSEEEDEEASDEEESDESEDEEEEKSSKPDLSKLTPKELLDASETLRREVQSQVDQGRNAERRKVTEEARQRRLDRQTQTEEDELDELLEDGDFEGYGRKKAEKDKASKKRLAALGEAQVDIAAGLKERYGRLLGETAVADVIGVLDNDFPQGYSLIDLSDALARKAADKDLQKKIEEELNRRDTEEEADEVEGRAKKRSKKVAKKKTASTNVSSSRRSKPVRKATTDAELEEQYGDGEIPFDELPDNLKKKYGG